MSVFQQKIMRHAKKNMLHSKEKIETIPEKDLMVNLLDTDFKTTVLNMLREVKEDVEKKKIKGGQRI